MKSQNKDEFKDIVRHWSSTLKVHPSQIRVQRMRSKWASCSSHGWVSFSDDLLVEQQELQEYVIVHELLHLRVPNHGKLFRTLMSLYLPDWPERDRRLKSRSVRIL